MPRVRGIAELRRRLLRELAYAQAQPLAVQEINPTELLMRLLSFRDAPDGAQRGDPPGPLPMPWEIQDDVLRPLVTRLAAFQEEIAARPAGHSARHLEADDDTEEGRMRRLLETLAEIQEKHLLAEQIDDGGGS